MVNDSNDYTMKRYDASDQSSARHPGPNLLLLTLIYLAFLVLGASQVSASFHIPLDSASKAVAFVAASGGSIKWGSFFELASAMPLCVFIATTTSRLRFLGVRAAGESIAFLGGIIATTMLMLSALSTWSLTRPGVAETAGAVHALQALGFIGGGPGFVVPLGLFLAGVSVTAGISGFVPRWVMWLGIVTAVACELASFTLVNFTAGYFIPAGRFISILWMIAVSLTLPIGKPAAQS
jgi:hypothetical protein